MTDELTNCDFFGASETVAPLTKYKKKGDDEKSYKDANIDVEKYEKTKVKRITFRYVPKQD